jgi:hypothetical protein
MLKDTTPTIWEDSSGQKCAKDQEKLVSLATLSAFDV